MPNSLKTYLDAVRQVADAEAATLFIPASAEGETPAFLCHSGAQPPISELRDLETASAFVRAQAQAAGEADDDHRLVRVLRGTENTYLLRLSIADLSRFWAMHAIPADLSRRRRSRHAPSDDDREDLWFGVRWPQDETPQLPDGLDTLKAETGSRDGAGTLLRLLASSAHLVWSSHRCVSAQQDPLCHLPGRWELKTSLRRALTKAVAHEVPLSLLLVNPDDFAAVNQRLGRKRGDTVLEELAGRIKGALRQSDQAFRYGGAVFVVLLPETDREAAKAVADKVRHALSRAPYAQETVRLAFSMGLAVYDPQDPGTAPKDGDEMLLWADNAINQAKLQGGGRTLVWDQQGDATVVGSLDRLSGIFTADTEKDYRNMLLLWDTVAFIASNAEGDAIAREFVERIGAVFKPLRAALVSGDQASGFRLLAEYLGGSASPWLSSAPPGRELPLSDLQRRLFEKVSERRQVERQHLEIPTPKGARRSVTAYGIPLLAADAYQGALYLEIAAQDRALDSSDIIFLSALANQVANALAHAYLAARWKRQKEIESTQLKQEVRGLREVLRQTKMVFQSEQMQGVMERLRKVAPTDATVLVTGESGTGKEMLARSLHEMSLRKDRPFVTVDCGAISPTLMESELFGRAKGAYTSADTASTGRILEADGGTLFLDEIGELPLDVQAKLLRFVQEKEITPVGASRTRRVDVRIVAATNRKLAEEVKVGNFRQDLYYRLQVFVVESLPLRKRADDILPLARYFVEKYSVQYHKGPLRLAPEAEAALLAYPWPGNVRELQNQILQAIIMCSTDAILLQDLNLRVPDEESSPMPFEAPESRPAVDPPLMPVSPEDPPRWSSPPPTDVPPETGDPWVALGRELERQVERSLAGGKHGSEPLGRWLGEDLVLLADEMHGGVTRRAALMLGMAETTFRRKIEKAHQERDSGRLVRTGEWQRLVPVLRRLLDSLEHSPQANVEKRIHRTLLTCVVGRLADQDKQAAALMGVTLPTYRRWKEKVTASEVV